MAQDSLFQVLLAVEWIDQLLLIIECHGVDRQVAPLQVVLNADC